MLVQAWPKDRMCGTACHPSSTLKTHVGVLGTFHRFLSQPCPVRSMALAGRLSSFTLITALCPRVSSLLSVLIITIILLLDILLHHNLMVVPPSIRLHLLKKKKKKSITEDLFSTHNTLIIVAFVILF